jgi:hypothetical protein
VRGAIQSDALTLRIFVIRLVGSDLSQQAERVRRIGVLMGGDDRKAGRVVTGVFM